MKLEVAKAIENAANEIGGLDIEVREGYSGRGMFGRQTAGIVFACQGDLLRAVALAAVRVNEDNEDAHGDEDRLSLDEFLDGLPTSQDSMGHSGIAY